VALSSYRTYQKIDAMKKKVMMMYEEYLNEKVKMFYRDPISGQSKMGRGKVTHVNQEFKVVTIRFEDDQKSLSMAFKFIDAIIPDRVTDSGVNLSALEEKKDEKAQESIKKLMEKKEDATDSK